VDVARSKNVPLIRKLVKMKGMPNNHCHSKDGANALVECCKNGSIEGFKAILMAGANIDSPNKKGVRMCVRGWVVPPSSQAVGSCVIPVRPYSLPARAPCSSAQSRTFN
jgi:ankyrin repeat protein